MRRDCDPSLASRTSSARHPLPQGERGRKRVARPELTLARYSFALDGEYELKPRDHDLPWMKRQRKSAASILTNPRRRCAAPRPPPSSRPCPAWLTSRAT